MKRIATFFLLFAFIYPFPAWALTSVDGRDLPKGNRPTVSATESVILKDKLLEKVASGEAQEQKVQVKRSANIRKYFDNMMEKIDNNLERLTKIAARIESRLGKMKTAGKDVSVLETKLNQARLKITALTVLEVQVKSQFETLLTANDPKASFTTVKKTVKDITTGLKEVHTSLIAIITQMKGMSPEIKPTGNETESESGTPPGQIIKRITIAPIPTISPEPTESLLNTFTPTP